MLHALLLLEFTYIVSAGSMGKHTCGDISVKYYIASYMFCDTFKVKCSVSGGAHSVQFYAK